MLLVVLSATKFFVNVLMMSHPLNYVEKLSNILPQPMQELELVISRFKERPQETLILVVVFDEVSSLLRNGNPLKYTALNRIKSVFFSTVREQPKIAGGNSLVWT